MSEIKPCPELVEAKADIDVANELISGFRKTSGCYYADAKGVDHWIVKQVASVRQQAITAVLDGSGWVYFSPDVGEEYAPQHPIKSGETPDAENVRRSTAMEDALHEHVNSISASLNRASDACATVKKERDAWKGALIDELVMCHIYTKDHEIDPKRALNDAIVWHVKAALDPAVSSDAGALIERGRQEVLRDAVELARFAWDHYPNPDTNHVDYRVEVARKAKAFLARYEASK